MNREKLNRIAFNIFWCVPSFVMPFFILSEIAEMHIVASTTLALYIFVLHVKSETTEDILLERIKNLEKQKTEK